MSERAAIPSEGTLRHGQCLYPLPALCPGPNGQSALLRASHSMPSFTHQGRGGTKAFYQGLFQGDRRRAWVRVTPTAP